MKTFLGRLAAGVWVVALMATLSAGAVAQSDSTMAEAGELEALHQRIDATIAEIRRLSKRLEQSEGEMKTLLEHRRHEKRLQVVDDVNELSERLVKEEAAGRDIGQMREVMTGYLQLLMPGLRTVIDQQTDKVIALMTGKPPEDLRAAMSHEIDMHQELTALVDWYSDYYRSTGNLDAFGIAATEEREYLTGKLHNVAEFLADTIGVTTNGLEDARFLLTLTPDDKDLQTRAKLIELRRDTAVTNLTAVTEILEPLGIDGSEYTSLALQVSGDVSTGLLETGVWGNLLRQWGENTWSWVTENSLDWILKLLILLVILYVAWKVSRIVRRIVEQAVDRLSLSRLLRRMIVATAANGVLVIGVLIALSQVGISIGPVLAGLGIAGIIIGFALQDTLSNFASGMMILIYRPYDVGDLIDAGGEFGTVSDMNLVSTVIMTIDNQRLVIPNNLIWKGVIRNVTAQQDRRVDMTFGISYDDDIPKAERILEDILASHEKVLDDPEPMVRLHTLGESSVDFVVRPWVKTDDYWDVYWDITREVKIRFDAEGVSIPYPQRDVHLYPAGGEAASEGSGTRARPEPVRSSTGTLGPDINDADE